MSDKEIQQFINKSLDGLLLAVKVQLGCRSLDLEALLWNMRLCSLITRERPPLSPMLMGVLPAAGDESQRGGGQV